MPTFKYQAIDAHGVLQAGEIVAASQVYAVDQLHRRGLTPTDLRGADEGKNALAFSRDIFRKLKSSAGPKLGELLVFTSSLSALLKAGLTVDRALAIVAALGERETTRSTFARLATAVRAGNSFADALEGAEMDLPPYYGSMVRAGEAGGMLPSALQRLAELLRRQVEVRERVRSAMVYPLLLAGIVLVTMVVLLVFVLPQFQALFDESDAVLPVSTRAVLKIGQVVSTYWWLLAFLAIGAGISVQTTLRSKRGRSFFDHWILKSRFTFGLPLKLNSARLLRTAATLLQSGVTLPAALRLARGTLSNGYLRQSLDTIVTKVNSGQTLTSSFAEAGIFPPHAVQLAKVGEETGRLDELLTEAALILEGESQTSLERLLNMLVPVLTILMGLVVAVLIGSVLIGLLSINELAF